MKFDAEKLKVKDDVL